MPNAKDASSEDAGFGRPSAWTPCGAGGDGLLCQDLRHGHTGCYCAANAMIFT